MLNRLPIQPAGWVVLAVGVASLVGALLLGWRELLVLAIGCAVTLVLSLGFIVGRSDVRLSRQLLPDRVTVGDPAVVELAASNPGSVRTARQTIHESIDGEHVPVALKSLKPGEESIERWTPSTDRRGVRRLGPARITKADPCRLMQRDVGQTGVDLLWVQPRVLPLSSFIGGLTKDMDGPTFDHSPAGDVAFHAIRPYRIGDDARHVHWMATARAGEMMVRHYVDNRQQYLSVVIDTNEASWDSIVEFDAAIDIAASLGVSSIEGGQPMSLHAGDRPLVGRQQRTTRQRVLDDLTVVDTDLGFDLTTALTPLIAAERNTTVAVILTGANRPVHELAAPTTNLAQTCSVILVCIGTPATGGDDTPAPFVPARGVRTVDVTDVYDFAAAISASTAAV